MRQRDKIEKSCKYCEKPIPNSNTYCNNQCQADYQNAKKLTEWKETGFTTSKGKIGKWLRNYLYEKCNYKCTQCGFSGTNPFHGRTILEIDHIDGNHLNNKEDNLRVLCPNCHAMTPTFRNTGGRKGTRKYRV
jgi:5-methylcytosine-specific restriction endonuclease McrA